MSVEATMGLFRDRVVVRGTEYGVRRTRGGWRQIVDAHGGGRVHYDGWRDRLSIESPRGSVRIQFRWRNTTFSWRGRVYRVDRLLWNLVTILDGERPVVQGRITWSGVRFEHVDPALVDIERELAVGLSLRIQAFAMVITAVH